jgi:hypothetical protein
MAVIEPSACAIVSDAAPVGTDDRGNADRTARGANGYGSSESRYVTG